MGETAQLPPPPPPPPISEHEDLAVMLRQVRFLHWVQGFREQGMGEDQAIGAAIVVWADSQG